MEMEHHALGRPLIKSQGRRKPSVVRLANTAEFENEATQNGTSTVLNATEPQFVISVKEANTENVPQQPKTRDKGTTGNKQPKSKRDMTTISPATEKAKPSASKAKSSTSKGKSSTSKDKTSSVPENKPPKWVQILGFPVDEKQAKKERRRVAKVAKKRGADKKTCKLLASRIRTVEEELKHLEEQKLSIDALNGRLMLGMVLERPNSLETRLAQT